MKKKLLDDFVFPSASFYSYLEYSEKGPSVRNLKEVFMFTDKELNTYGKSLSSFNSGYSEVDKYLKKLSWAIRAYLTAQDTFDYSVREIPKSSRELFDGRNYCYYESMVYLRQITWSIVNGNSLAATCLLRPFLELSVYNLYWDQKRIENPEKTVLSWLDGKIGKPPVKDAIDWVGERLQQNELTKELVVSSIGMLQNGYKGVSSYSHTPKWNESFGKKTGNLQLTELEDLEYVIHMTTIALYNLVNLYAVAYPTMLFPVDVLRRFGFNAPVGLINDKYNFEILCRFLGEEHCSNLADRLKDTPQVVSMLDWVSSRPTLTDEEIRLTFDRKRNPTIDPEQDLGKLYVADKVKTRALMWAMNYIGADKATEDPDTEEFRAGLSFFDKLYEN